MSEENKHIGKAERLLQKGKPEAALEEYLLAWKEAPENDGVVQIVADLYQRLSRSKESYQCYAYLFDKYLENQEGPKAIEVLRKLQRLGPVDPQRLLRCAQFLEKQSPEEAADHYRRALDAVAGQDAAATLECLQGLARVQPSSVEVQARIAATAGKLGKTELAVAAYRKVAALRIAEAKYPEAIDALEGACRLPGAPPAVQLELARAYGRAGRHAQVLSLLTKTAPSSDDPEILELLAQAYRAEQQIEKAEGIYWKLLERNAAAVHPLLDIALEHLRRENTSPALETLQKIEQHLSTTRPGDLASFAEKLGQREYTQVPVLEYLTRLFDRLHLDVPLSKALNQLFDLHFAGGQFRKAAEALERLIPVDIYAPECTTKLQQLEGKVEPAVWQGLASQLGQASTTGDLPTTLPEEPASETPSEAEPGSAAAGSKPLHDLMLQTEIFLQYKLEDKARERLQQIAKLFPREEEKNEDLRNLFERARFKPQHEAAPAPALVAEPQGPRDHFSRVSEISRNLSRQGTVKGVLFAAVNDIGRHWQVSRCVAGLLTPSRPPTMGLEYIAPGTPPSDPGLLGKLLMSLQQITLEQGSPLVAESVSKVPALGALQSSLETLKVESLMAILLRDGDQPMGLLVLEQCGSSRVWKANDRVSLETLAEQIVLTVSNVRLRNLMKTLAVTEEQSGLLRRESYIPCLLSETERSRTQKAPLSGVILHFSAADSSSPSRQRQPAGEALLGEVSSALVSRLRQNDIAVRYGPQALALILPGTTGKEALAVAEKLRKLALTTPVPTGAASPPRIAVAIAEAVPAGDMESVDVVTELINRLEGALEAAQRTGATAKLAELPALHG